MLIIMYQTNTEHPAVTFTMNPMHAEQICVQMLTFSCF